MECLSVRLFTLHAPITIESQIERRLPVETAYLLRS